MGAERRLPGNHPELCCGFSVVDRPFGRALRGVCDDPVSEFSRIFEFCGLPFSAAAREEIERSSQAKVCYVPGAYDTARNSLAMKDLWKLDVDPEDIEQVRRGYFAYRPIFYREESDWMSA